MIFCCATLEDVTVDERLPISFNARFRRFQMPVASSASVQILMYCPFCGSELPDCTDLYYDKLEELFGAGVDFSSLELPVAFKTEVWWQELTESEIDHSKV